MIRKIAIAVGVLVVLVLGAVTWRFAFAPASAEGCVLDRTPPVTRWEGNKLRMSFSGHADFGLVWELKRELFGMFADDDGCGLTAEVSLESNEPGSFPIAGEAEYGASGGWTFKPAAGNHPKITFASVHVGHSFGDTRPTKLWVSGELTIDQAQENVIAGRLKLRSEGSGGGRMSAPFSTKPGKASSGRKTLEQFVQ